MNSKRTITGDQITARLVTKRGSKVYFNANGPETYARYLGFQGNTKELKNDIKGKKVLDVTAGYDLFGSEINSDPELRALGTIVISTDPILVEPEHIETSSTENFFVGKEQKLRLTAAAISQRVAAWVDEGLPFKDASMDRIFDNQGLLVYYHPTDSHQKNVLKNAFSEMARVLKPDGEIRMGRNGQIEPEEFRDIISDSNLESTVISDRNSPDRVSGLILRKKKFSSQK